MNKETAINRDNTLRLFKGDVYVSMTDIKNKFGSSRNFHLTLQSLQHFVGEDIIEETGLGDGRRWKLRPKGYSMFAELDDHGDGYLRQWYKSQVRFWVMIGSFLVAVFTLLSVLFNWKISTESQEDHKGDAKPPEEQAEQQYKPVQQNMNNAIKDTTAGRPTEQDSLTKKPE